MTNSTRLKQLQASAKHIGGRLEIEKNHYHKAILRKNLYYVQMEIDLMREAK
jgi:hypothetical protein